MLPLRPVPKIHTKSFASSSPIRSIMLIDNDAANSALGSLPSSQTLQQVCVYIKRDETANAHDPGIHVTGPGRHK